MMNVSPKARAKDFDFDLVLSVATDGLAVYGDDGRQLNGEPWMDLLKKISITGIHVLVYCRDTPDGLIVRNMYYLDGDSWMTPEFMTKYLTGMGLEYNLHQPALEVA